jgi:Zn-dependent protease
MFRSVLVLGHLRGIRIELHVSWLVIFALLMASLSVGLRHGYPDWSMITVGVTALATVLLFFTSILAHEMGHSLVAIRRGVPVHAITLFIFGGMAQISKDSETAEDEFWIAIAGPAVSIALALAFGLLAVPAAHVSEPIAVALGWLAMINLIVAVFNLVPGFPLDGGRVFRALVWKLTGDAGKGMQAAVAGGRVVAYVLFGLGIWSMLAMGNLIGGLWIMIIAWFLLNMAEASGRMFSLNEALAGIRAGDLAERELPLVAPATSIEDWIHDRVLPEGSRSFFVGDHDNVLGLVTLTDARRVPRAQWSASTVEEIMTPADRLVSVEADKSVMEILHLINQHNLNQIAVMKDDRLYGWLDRQRLLKTIELHMELRKS